MGSLEDMDFVSESAGSNVRFEFIASSDVDSLGKEFLDLGYDPCVVEQVYGSLSVKVEQQINVALGTLGPTCCGTEQRDVFDAELLEAWRCGAENMEDGRNFLRTGGGRACGRVSQDRTACDEGYAGRFESRPDDGEIGRYGFALGTLKVGDGEPRDSRLSGQLSLGDAEESTGGAAYLWGQRRIRVKIHPVHYV